MEGLSGVPDIIQNYRFIVCYVEAHMLVYFVHRRVFLQRHHSFAVVAERVHGKIKKGTHLL